MEKPDLGEKCKLNLQTILSAKDAKTQIQLFTIVTEMVALVVMEDREL